MVQIVSSVDITWELVRNGKSWVSPLTCWIRNLWMGPHNLCFNKLARYFWCTLKIETYAIAVYCATLYCTILRYTLYTIYYILYTMYYTILYYTIYHTILYYSPRHIVIWYHEIMFWLGNIFSASLLINNCWTSDKIMDDLIWLGSRVNV